MNLHGKCALITGGGAGIGLGIAHVLASHGARIAVAQRNAPHLRDLPPGTITIQADISDRRAVERMIDEVAIQLGRIDIVVNNASVTGKPAIAGFLACEPRQLDAIVDTNLKGTFHVSQLAARRMVAQGEGGCIIHITSVGAYAAQELASVYCATKAAQVSLAQGMSLELAPHRIRVNAIAAGDIETPASASIVSDLKNLGSTHRFLRRTPLGRRGSPEEIGHAVAFLASEEASFITGTTLLVDGGFLSY